MGKSFIEDINLIRGWAIFLVVLGHISFMESVPLYQSLRGLIVRFHMPLFMIISGYLYARGAKKRLVSFKEYGSFVLKKTKRLVPAYLFTTFLILFIKSAAGNYFSLMTPVTPTTLKMMFIYPMEGFVVYLWFIYTLYIIFILFPIIDRLLSKINIHAQTLIYFLLLLVPVPKLMCLNLVFKYMIFFHIGQLVYEADFRRPRHVNILLGLSMLIFACGHASVNSIAHSGAWLEGAFLITALSGVSASYLFILKVKDHKGVLYRLFNTIGHHAFEIYLFHSLGTESIAHILRAFIPAGPVYYSLHIGASIACGLYVPILFVKALRRVMPTTGNVLFGRT